MPSLKTVVDTSAENFWKAITSYDQYAAHLKGVNSVRVLNRTDNKVILEYNVEIIKKVVYEIVVTEHAPHTLSWELHRGSLFKRNSGSWVLEPEGNNKVHVTYTLDVDFAVFVPKMMINSLVGTQMPKTLDEFKRWAEGMN